VDAEITLAESSQWAADEIEAGATATAIHAPKIHHFVELMLHLVPQQSGSMPAAVRDKEAAACSILNVAAVSRSIIHCIRTRR
jgi:hypothetical protein